MAAIRAASTIGIGVAAAMAISAFASPAKADWHRHYWYHGWGPGVVYAAPPYYYAPPPAVVYAPPPAVVYAPPPAYYSPGISLGVAIR